MAHGTGIRLKANELEIANNTLTNKVLLLQTRLEIVADMLIKHDLLQNNPHVRYLFVNGGALHNFPVWQSETTDVDGLQSVG